MCAKVEGEACGGKQSYHGKCDRGLYCQPDEDSMSLYVLEPRDPPKGHCTRFTEEYLKGDSSWTYETNFLPYRATTFPFQKD